MGICSRELSDACGSCGTRGAALVGGAEQIKIPGQYLPVRAEVHNLEMLSAHGDANEIMGPMALG